MLRKMLNQEMNFHFCVEFRQWLHEVILYTSARPHWGRGG